MVFYILVSKENGNFMPLFTFRRSISESSGKLFSVCCCSCSPINGMEATFRDGAVWSQNVVLTVVAGTPWIMLEYPGL